MQPKVCLPRETESTYPNRGRGIRWWHWLFTSPARFWSWHIWLQFWNFCVCCPFLIRQSQLMVDSSSCLDWERTCSIEVFPLICCSVWMERGYFSVWNIKQIQGGNRVFGNWVIQEPRRSELGRKKSKIRVFWNRAFRNQGVWNWGKFCSKNQGIRKWSLQELCHSVTGSFGNRAVWESGYR